MMCEFCNGTGMHPLIPDIECDNCYGQGVIGQVIEVDLSQPPEGQRAAREQVREEQA